VIDAGGVQPIPTPGRGSSFSGSFQVSAPINCCVSRVGFGMTYVKRISNRHCGRCTGNFRLSKGLTFGGNSIAADDLLRATFVDGKCDAIDDLR